MKENDLNKTIADIIKILRGVIDILRSEDTDLIWSQFSTVDELVDVLHNHITQLIKEDFSELDDLCLLFAPTASLQEISISSGWGSQFLLISEKFDKIIGDLRKKFKNS